jgi:hypothetical protein
VTNDISPTARRDAIVGTGTGVLRPGRGSIMSIRVIPAAVLVATLLAVGILGGQPHPAAAAAGDAESGATTYQLDPANGRLNVTVTVKVKNSIPNTSESYSCVQYRYDPSYGYLPYAGTCSRTTRYYLDSTSLWIENEATGIKASSGGTTLSAKAGQKAGAWHLVTVGFPKLWNGQSRTVKVTYVLKSAAPRSGSTIRLMQAYASFCVLAAAGVDPGSITVRVPAGFTFTTSGTPLSAKVIGSERVYSGSVADPSSYWTCFEGTNEAGFRSDQVAGPGGRQVQVKSWPEDTAWATAVEADVAKGLPALTRLVGVEPPGTAPLVVKESVTGSDYAGFYEMGTNTITVGEDFDQPSLVEHELAHVWFNNSLFDGTWLSEGSAGWAGRATSGDEAPCSRPATGAAGINLNAWAYLTPRSTDADRATVAA